MKLYHSTKMENLKSISEEGLLPDMFGLVFLAESALLAAAFDVIYNDGRGIVLEVEVPEECISESFDHSEAFFARFIVRPSARCYTYHGTIEPELINFDISQTSVQVVQEAQND